jgi:type III restriction enzyme
MATTIENPILNGPFEAPKRHFRFDEEGITNEVVESRRRSAYFMPIARPKKKNAQKNFETEWTLDRIKETTEVNRIRDRVDAWRAGGYVSVTSTTRRLLDYWNDPDRERRLFFCQREAVETAIYITEVAAKYGDAWIQNFLAERNAEHNASLPRIAMKMATGSGKTVVMAMLIAWQALNKLDNRQDARFSDAFLIVTPGITIRDRLRVLLPSDPDNYYRFLDILPPDFRERLGQARISIANYHAFLLRERGDAARLTKSILTSGASVAQGSSAAKDNPFRETPDQMVRRVARDLSGKKNLVVINDEAHHCYWRKPDAEADTLSGEERAEAKQRDEDARVWSAGLEGIQNKLGIRAIYDLSATPFFLSGSGYPEGTLFPWVVSDFSLIDAIEAGIVKIPRVPVADNQMSGDSPTYRRLWEAIRDDLPSKGRRTDAVSGPPKLPAELQAALHSLYGHYRLAFEKWEQNAEARARGQTPPVFVVVCSNTNVSKLVFDWIAGWNTGKVHPDGAPLVAPGNLPVFSNENGGRWTIRPNAILVDSSQLESEEGMSPEFKKIAAAEIEEFKAEYRARFPGRDADDLTDEDLLREVMNTVGKAGKLGEHVRCVVSVSMLTEGWDTNTVTHILGIRAFGTQLLCEQVVGRGLRRMSYALNEAGHFNPEYAEVYGVPFSFIPTAGSGVQPTGDVRPTRVRALEDRAHLEITFPRVTGYRFDNATERLDVRFGEEARLTLSTSDVPTIVESAPIVGEKSVHTLDDLKGRREAEVLFLLAKLTHERYFPEKPWLFPQLLSIGKRWLRECVTCKDDAFLQLLLLVELAHDAADRIYRSIVASTPGAERLIPILKPYEARGTTRYVDFDTVKNTYVTDPESCHVSHVVADTGSWEQKVASALERMGEVVSYVKNQGLGQKDFTIPYTMNGEDKSYYPDFIARVDTTRVGQDRLPGSPKPSSGTHDAIVSVIIEVSGEERKDKANKVATARTLWVPAVNNDGGFGRWVFVEVEDPSDTKSTVRRAMRENLEGAPR